MLSSIATPGETPTFSPPSLRNTFGLNKVFCHPSAPWVGRPPWPPAPNPYTLDAPFTGQELPALLGCTVVSALAGQHSCDPLPSSIGPRVWSGNNGALIFSTPVHPCPQTRLP